MKRSPVTRGCLSITPTTDLIMAIHCHAGKQITNIRYQNNEIVHKNSIMDSQLIHAIKIPQYVSFLYKCRILFLGFTAGYFNGEI